MNYFTDTLHSGINLIERYDYETHEASSCRYVYK